MEKPFAGIIGRTQSDTIAQHAQAAARRQPHMPPLEMQAVQKQLSQKLESMKNSISAEEIQANEIIRKMREMRADLQDTLGSCHKTMETTSHCLEEYFRHIPPAKLFQHISMRFSHFDKDHSGTLDRAEVTEAMAEMGQRPTDAELDEFFAIFDKNKDHKINLTEFDKMVRCKLKLIPSSSLKSVAEDAENKDEKKDQKGWAKASVPPAKPKTQAAAAIHPIVGSDKVG
mmetsp:Transcript_115636/g.172805  ORF Transcript_115636/g.172805 Transcript_115636/m.172805 type:complete len:229 (+) Transcript_115636:110-796(+)